MTKRRISSLLPAYHQTPTLVKFFGATVDALFQPGTAEPISGFIGQKPSYNDPLKDFYLPEGTAERARYQLEPGMVSYNATGVQTHALAYPDLRAYLLDAGSNVTNDSRLFETDFFSWAPPVNIDALVNFHQYYWFGDADGDALMPTLEVASPSAAYAGDGATASFLIPADLTTIQIAADPCVYVDGQMVASTYDSATRSVTLASAPASGTGVIVYLVRDLVAALSGRTTIDLTELSPTGPAKLSSGMRIRIVDGIRGFYGWDRRAWDVQSWDADAVSTDTLTDDTFWVDGVGSSIRLTANTEMRYEAASGGVPPQYVTIDRSSTFSNDWSRRNFWVHQDAFAWANADLRGRQATRPIIEFVRDLNLFPGQTWAAGADPLFRLYDLGGVPLEEYTGSNFSGSRVFGYATGSGQADPVLNRALKHDSNGYILFTNDLATIRYTYSEGTITGLYAPAVGHDETLLPSWYPKAAPTSQALLEDDLYAIPLNLAANALNEDVGEISRSTWIEHFRDLISQQDGATGSPLSINNFRDTARDLSRGTQVLQHRAPMLKLMLLASDRNFDLPAAMHLADQEYNRFRNRFARKLVDLLNKGAIPPSASIEDAVTTALMALRVDKTPAHPFANSNMAGDQWFIPATPSALGITPCYTPGRFLDTSYGDAVTMLRGHDGSLTPSFGDWRDDAFLELEGRIYASIPESFKVDARPVFDAVAYMGNRFQFPANGYSRDEVQAMLLPIFQRWAQASRFDFRTNGIYNSDNPFTWNWRGTNDCYGDSLPGHWRAIYRNFFDTDRPDAEPWAMLGFADEPFWWQETYGVGPYGRAHPTLWADLEAGRIRGGSRAGIDARYARPGLSFVIPVDDSGALLDPLSAQIALTAPTIQQASAPWQPGDHGPVENLWMNSPSYRFALAQVGFLMKPTRFVEQCWNTADHALKGAQWVDLKTLARPDDRNDLVHGETDDTKADAVVARVGIQQWIVDAMISYGQSPTVLGDAVRGLQARLMHKIAGFVGAGDMKAVADNFGLLPSEDMQITLYNSPSLRNEFYSGVIIEWTGQSYRVLGYDNRDPIFRMIPPDVTGPKGAISLADGPEPVFYPWRPSTFYTVNTLVEHNNALYRANVSHNSGLRFAGNNWDLQGAIPARAPRVVTYLRGDDRVDPEIVTYGSEFLSVQDVADFLLGYERYLESRGWVFDVIDPETTLTRDWSAAVKEFLSWSQVRWEPGNFIALSPGAQELKFVAETGTVLDVEDSRTGFFGLVDRSGLMIQRRASRVTRLDGEVTMAANEADIFGARLRVAEIEHALIFSNQTIFDDAVYLPLYNMRQSRLRLIGQRSRGWAGRLDAPGFMLDGGNLLPNFEKTAEDIRLMFDIEQSDRAVLRNHARHLIGYQSRDYLESLLLSETQQFEFYQGMIAAKGSPGVFSTLLRSQRISEDSQIAFLEEWAFRVSSFGAPRDPRVTFQLRQIEMRRDPQVIRFAATAGQDRDWIELPSGDARWLDTVRDAHSFFPVRDAEKRLGVPTAGHVRLSEVKHTAFNLDALPALYTGPGAVAEGERIWVYDMPDRAWSVLRASRIGAASRPNTILRVVSQAEDASVLRSRIVFADPHGLTAADVGARIVVDGNSASEPDLMGIQIIYQVDVAGNWIEVGLGSSKGRDFSADASNAPEVRILRRVRYATQTALTADTSYTKVEGDIAYVDRDAAGLWLVRRFSNGAWRTIRNQPQRVDASKISKSMIYRNGSRVLDGRLLVNEPLIDHISVIDAVGGILPGVVDREIDFREDYDPALYSNGGNVSDDLWTGEEVGRLWWDLSTVRFIDPYTDRLGSTAARDVNEIDHRALFWNSIAPGSSVDVYEWVRSDVPPADWGKRNLADTTGAYTGTVYRADAPSWTEEVIYDARLGRERTVYYFWVKGRDIVPAVSFRSVSARTVAVGLENPTSLELPWIAPIAPDALIVSGVESVLNDVDTVIKVEVDSTVEGDVHSQWTLLRPKDERALPPEWLWRRLRDGLAAFDDRLRPLPSPDLHHTRSTGILEGQNIFAVAQPDPATPAWAPNTRYSLGTVAMVGPLPYRCTAAHTSGATFVATDWALLRDGLINAREAFMLVMNALLVKSPVAWERSNSMVTLDRETPVEDFLTWTRRDNSYPIEPAPRVEYDHEAFSLDDRSRIIAKHGPAAVRGNTRLRILMNNLDSEQPQWSIWELDREAARAAMASRDAPTSEAEALVLAAERIMTLARTFEYDATDDELLGAAAWQQSTDYEAGALIAYDRVVYRCTMSHNSALSFVSDYWSILYQTGDRVFRKNDASANGFWTIRRFEPGSPEADAQGFVLHRVQTYRTRDFWSLTDWYASGFSPSKPPMFTYATVNERNRAEGSSPSNFFVKVANDGTGHWMWTIFNQDAKAWQVVARQNGTVAFTENLTNPDLVVHGMGAPSTDTIANRDGSWELRVLADALRYGGILTDLELNIILFSLVYFIHSQQEEIDWAFKTSFMTVAGYHEPLRQTPVRTADQTESMISYVNEVKPYRVKVRDFSHQFAVEMDPVNVHATDFDKPVWFDDKYQEFRKLDPNNPADAAILANALPWQDWWTEHTKEDNRVRKINIKMLFDRITADPNLAVATWADNVPYFVGTLVEHVGYVYRCTIEHSSTVLFEAEYWEVVNPLSAADRIVEYFNPPTGGDPDLVSLLKTDFKATSITGAALFDFDMPVSEFDTVITGFDTAGFDTLIDEDYITHHYVGDATPTDLLLNPAVEHKTAGFALNDPYVAGGRPEEQVRLTVDDALLLKVDASALPGAPVHTARIFETRDTSAAQETFFFGAFAQKGDAIFVYRDGVRAVLGADYTFDFFARTVTVKLDASWGRVQKVLVHSFGVSSRSAIRDQLRLAGAGSTVLLSEAATADQVFTTLDGIEVLGVTTTGTQVTLPVSVPNGADLSITVVNGTTADLCTVNSETLRFNAAQRWKLASPDTHTVPEHAGTVVEVDGLRLTPPRTFYGSFSTKARWLTTDRDLAAFTVEVLVNGVRYTKPIPVITTVAMDGSQTGYPLNMQIGSAQLPADDGGPRFVIYDRYLVALNEAFENDNVILIASGDHDYVVENGWVTVRKPLTVENRIVATTFSNADLLDIRTYTYELDGDFEYPVRRPHASEYAMVAVNGRAVAPEKEFSFVDVVRDYDQQGFGDVAFDMTHSATVLTMPVSPDLRGTIVATLFNGRPAREAISWMTATTTPAANRMMPALDTGGFDMQRFALTGFDEAGDQLMSIRVDGGEPVPLFEMKDRWEHLVHSPNYSGRLAEDFMADDSTIRVLAPQSLTSQKLRAASPFTLPDIEKRQPGVVWIGQERIEFFDIVEVNNVIVLGELRRGTQGTSQPPEVRTLHRFTASGSRTSFSVPDLGAYDVFVDGKASEFGVQHSVEISDTGMVVRFKAPPRALAKITVGVTKTHAHLAGAPVIDGTLRFSPEVPVGPSAGNRDLEPMRSIIAR